MFDKLKQAWGEASHETKILAGIYVTVSSTGLFLSGGVTEIALAAAFGFKAVASLDKDMARAQAERIASIKAGPWNKSSDRTPSSPA